MAFEGPGPLQIRLAHDAMPSADVAVSLTQAELQMSGGQWEQSLATLLQLKSSSPRHPQVLAMLAEVFEELADWQALLGAYGVESGR